MLICTVYPSDDNVLLKTVQHDVYPRSVAQLYECARAALLWADRVLEARLLIAEKARGTTSFDHRVLQDILAAAFRHSCDDGGQLRLLEGDAERANRYRSMWLEWLQDELADLSKDPIFVRSTVQAVVLAHSELGYAAERVVCQLLFVRYGLDDWGKGSTYGKAYGGCG
jgi:hypothetical protein